MFDQIFTQTTASAALNLALKRIYNNKSELLLVLDRPDIPLHNNSAENAIREYVKRRKISGSTRSENRPSVPGYLYQFEKDLSQIGCIVLAAISKTGSRISATSLTCQIWSDNKL
jgi:hypothetical protein